ncbi:hypothetical protein A7K94_0210585 [Modestobacter sp. VKM Ac-2676]|nr:hypothetical protein A7K94_0210585 [Modestobacter sp. VKM Ac-2676]
MLNDRPTPGTVGFVAKDPWHPAIRREQMIAAELVRRGSAVRFVQPPADWRRVRTDPVGWGRHLLRGRFLPAAPGVEVTERSTVRPGSRSRTAEVGDATLLRGFLRRSDWDPELTVFQLPWDWRAARGLPAGWCSTAPTTGPGCSRTPAGSPTSSAGSPTRPTRWWS